MTFNLTNDIPLPQKERYPFEQMSVGDSFYSEKRSARTAAMNYQKKNGVKFASRREGAGVRLWRIA